MAFKMKGYSAFTKKEEKEYESQTKTRKDISTDVLPQTKTHATYETTMYDKGGNIITDVSEEFTGKIQRDETGRRFANVEEGGKRDIVYFDKPKKK